MGDVCGTHHMMLRSRLPAPFFPTAAKNAGAEKPGVLHATLDNTCNTTHARPTGDVPTIPIYIVDWVAYPVL